MTPLRQRYTHDLQLRNYAPRTVDCYVRRVAAFARHFGQSPERLDAEHVRLYQLHLLEQRASWCRFNQAVRALRFLFRVTLRRPGEMEMVPYGKRPGPLPCVLGTDEVRRLFDAAEPTTRLILQTAYACGLRVGAVVRLQPGDIDAGRMVVHVRRAKGRKDRLVPLSPLLLQRLRERWLRHRPAVWLFPGQRQGAPVSISHAQRLCQRAVRAAGITKKASTHTLRHSYATHLPEGGTDLATLRKLPGHSQLSTTLRYTHVQQAHLQRALSPLDALPGPPAAAEEEACTIPPWMSGPSSAATPTA
jgi:integrase/recombinase XerD